MGPEISLNCPKLAALLARGHSVLHLPALRPQDHLYDECNRKPEQGDQENNENTRQLAVSKVLKKIGAKKNRKSRPSGYVLPILGEARASWNAQPDLPAQNWDEAADWAGSVEPW